MKYKVEVEEVLCRIVEIEAESPADAESKVRDLYRSKEIVVDAGDFIGEPTFKVLQ